MAACLAAGCLSVPPPGTVEDGDADATPVACTAGEVIAPLAAINASPIDPRNACDVDNVLVRDGQVAGLDRFGVAADCVQLTPPDDADACGCVEVDLGAIYPVSEVVVVAASTADACGAPCQVPNCGTGHAFAAWYAAEPGAWVLAGLPDVTSTLADRTVTVDAALRYVVVCRDSWGPLRDDLAVDAIEARCR